MQNKNKIKNPDPFEKMDLRCINELQLVSSHPPKPFHLVNSISRSFIAKSPKLAEEFYFEEKDILRVVLAGDSEAFAKLLKKYWNGIYSQALAYTKSHQGAEDIVQNVFSKIWQSRESLTGVEGFENFLFIVARNRIISSFRKKLSQPSGSLEDFDFPKKDWMELGPSPDYPIISVS
ncbi:MAG TPA: sigma-70 family RNA polymerase sigma factor, partial [Puia sp.]|nr:sigma-70 family RNA polymerase sigma factor [Puia sp.]